MKLLTKKIENQLKKYPLYSQDGVKDKMVICKFFFGSCTWYVTEGEKQGNDYMFYGLVDMNGEKDLGYFTLSQLQSVKKWGLSVIERDMYFIPCLMSAIKD